MGFSSRAAVGDIAVTQLMVGGMERGEKDIEWQDFVSLFFFFFLFPGLEFNNHWAQKKKKRAIQTNK